MRVLRLKFLQGSHQHRGMLPQRLAEHRCVSRVLERGGRLDIDEFALVRRVSAGPFVRLTPNAGIQTSMMSAGSLTFRAEVLAALVGSFVSHR